MNLYSNLKLAKNHIFSLIYTIKKGYGYTTCLLFYSINNIYNLLQK
jgi:hypothetical protein